MEEKQVKVGMSEQNPLVHDLRVHQIELEMQNQELQEANQRLEEAARRYRELYDFAPLGYFTLDPEGKILEANLTAVDILGRPRNEIVGTSLYLSLHWEDRDILYRHLRSVFQNGPCNCVLRIVSKDGEERFFRFQSQKDHSGNTPYCRSAAVDITAIRKTQEELAAVNELNESLVQSVDESLLVLDVHLRVVTANTAFYDTFRLDPSRIKKKSIWELGKGEWLGPDLNKSLERLSVRGSEFDNLELTGEFPRIGRRELRIGARLLRNTAAGSRRILLLIQDLTERKKAERRMQQIVQKLEEANHRLDQFASVVSHDLKNPLRAIANYVGFLSQDLNETLSEAHRNYLEGIETAVHLAEKQVTGLLELSRISEIEPDFRRIRLGTMIRKVVASFATIKTVRIELNDKWPIIVTEPMLLQQVLSNLLENAVKYNVSKAKRIELGWTPQPGRNIELFVRDNGSGIPPEHHDKIFLAFRRLHSQTTVKGSGLGLSIVRAAVDRLGGSIRLESEVGKGSTFYVRLSLDGYQPSAAQDQQSTTKLG